MPRLAAATPFTLPPAVAAFTGPFSDRLVGRPWPWTIRKPCTFNPRPFMPPDACPYPRWERQGPVSRFCLAPGVALYEVKAHALISGTLFVAWAVDTTELIGQFESEHNARQACARLRPASEGRESEPPAQKPLSLDGAHRTRWPKRPLPARNPPAS